MYVDYTLVLLSRVALCSFLQLLCVVSWKGLSCRASLKKLLQLEGIVLPCKSQKA
jgi:hypothetical protein